MIKAHSLLYAIYVCLIVSLICGALLYFATLYTQLNLHYNLREELYIHNQSTVNYALGSAIPEKDLTDDDNTGIAGSYIIKQYGLLKVVLASTSSRNDTVTSAHFIGHYSNDKTAIYLANQSKALTYSGTVKLIGNNQLPTTFIETAYINSKPNLLTQEGKNTVSENLLTEISQEFKKIFEGIKSQKTALSDVDKPMDSLYYNSFLKETKEIYVNAVLANVIFKGNFILRSKDSIRVKKNTVLEDVILIAPKITFEEGFKGAVQVFATKGIELEQNVTLDYPSVVCVYNQSRDESKIKIKQSSYISGAVVLFGNALETIYKNSIEIDESGLILGDVYCSGKLFLKSKVHGSVYTNRFFYKTQTSTYDNTIVDIEIDATKRPKYFIAIPLFDTKKTKYGILKKVL